MSKSTNYPPPETPFAHKKRGFEAHSRVRSQNISNGPNFQLEKKKID